MAHRSQCSLPIYQLPALLIYIHFLAQVSKLVPFIRTTPLAYNGSTSRFS